MTQEALMLALDALDNLMYWDNGKPDYDDAREAITAIKKALREHAMREVQRLGQEIEQPKVRTGDCLLVGVCASEGHKIAPQRTWVGLTDEEIAQGCEESWVTEQAFQSAVWWAEAKLKEKNT